MTTRCRPLSVHHRQQTGQPSPRRRRPRLGTARTDHPLRCQGIDTARHLISDVAVLEHGVRRHQNYFGAGSDLSGLPRLRSRRHHCHPHARHGALAPAPRGTHTTGEPSRPSTPSLVLPALRGPQSVRQSTSAANQRANDDPRKWRPLHLKIRVRPARKEFTLKCSSRNVSELPSDVSQPVAYETLP